MKKTGHVNSFGFSLMEVMVAMVILAVALTGLTRGMTAALRTSKEAEWQATAAWLAAGQIELLRTEASFPIGVVEGQGAGILSSYRWKQTIASTPIAGLRDVSVEIRHAALDQPLYELRTLLFEVPSDSLTNRPSERNGNERNRKNRGNRR